MELHPPIPSSTTLMDMHNRDLLRKISYAAVLNSSSDSPDEVVMVMAVEPTITHHDTQHAVPMSDSGLMLVCITQELKS